ncbi:MAG: hypothetical protein K9J74_12580 [Sulfuritalea sp.]|nr:hypothetical protein [Sulfuritalea sp.]
MTPSKEELETRVKHFANTVFVIGSGILMVIASLLQPWSMATLGGAMGEQATFIVATILILVLASKRPALALYAAERQCRKYGHVISVGSQTCGRCFQPIDGN